MKIILLRRALADAKKVIIWWRTNRTAAPFLFEDELRAAQLLLLEFPM
jgi:hypothetical protein